MTTPPTVHHITLSVTDVHASARWYQALLGPADAVTRAGEGWTRVRLGWGNGLVIGVTRHDGTTARDRFDHRRVGLDHLGLACASPDAVREWAALMDELGVVHGPVEEAGYGWAVTARDPDGIAVEFFCPAW
jgi:catechol 2,3-dioxygenase-like lactoylglutathione lyase family enzyme